MSLISNVNKTLYAIRNKLQNNDKITKMLFYSVANPLEQAALTAEQKNQIITLSPVVEYNIDPNTTLNHFISIGVPGIAFGNNLDGVIVQFELAIVCHTDYWELNNNKLRLMSIAEEVFNELNQKSFSLSGKLMLDSYTPEIFKDSLVGYRLTGYFMDSDLDIELE